MQARERGAGVKGEGETSRDPSEGRHTRLAGAGGMRAGEYLLGLQSTSNKHNITERGRQV